MKVLMIEPGPAYSVQDVHNGVQNALHELGVNVASFNLSDRLNFYTQAELTIDGETRRALEYEAACAMAAQGIRAAAWDFGPDVVIIVSSFFIPPQTYESLRRRGVHVVLWCTESPYEDTRQIRIAPYADTVILNDPVNINEFRQYNKRTYYIPHSYDPRVHHPRGRVEKYPFSFVGTGYPSRIEFFEKTDLPAGSVLAGNWQQLTDDSPLLPFLIDQRDQCIDNTDTADLYRQSTMSCNLYRKEAMESDLADGWAMGPREVEMAMCGTWFARNPRGEGDDVLWMLPTFAEPGELSDILRWGQANPEQRNQQARQAAKAIADRTFVNNVSHVLSLIEA